MISYQYDYNHIKQNYQELMNIIYFINLLVPLLKDEFSFILSFEKDNHYKVHFNNFKMSLIKYLESLKVDLTKSINGELGKIQKNSKEFKIYFITAFTVNQKNYFKISCNFKKNNIKPHIKSYLSKILIRELNLKGVNFNLIF